jgi:hypothetical protein
VHLERELNVEATAYLSDPDAMRAQKQQGCT